MNLSLNKAVDMTQNHPLWRLMSMFGIYALIVVHARNEYKKYHKIQCGVAVDKSCFGRESSRSSFLAMRYWYNDWVSRQRSGL